MNIRVTDQEHCKKELILEFSSEEVLAETDSAAADLARTLKVPGFRPGRVPITVIKSRFRKNLLDDAVSKLLPRGFDSAVQEKGLRVLGKPVVTDVKHETDGSIGVTFNLEVAPEFDLSVYNGLPLVKKVRTVTESDIDRAIDRLRERYAELAPVEDRPSRAGDTVVASMSGRFLPSEIDGDEKAAAIEGKDDFTEPNFSVELGQQGLLPDFDQALTGISPGDKKEFVVEYPKDFNSEKFAGKSVRYKAEIISISVKEVPDVDEDFVQTVTGEDKTIENFRAEIGSGLEREAELRAKQSLNGSAVDALTDRNRFELPSSLVERQMTSRTNSLLHQLSLSGVDPRNLKMDWQDVRESQRAIAERELRASFILDRISELENLTATDEEVSQRIEAVAAASSEDPAVLRARLTKENALDSMKAQVRNEKALDLVTASADVRIEKVDGLSEEAIKGGEDKQGT